MFSGRASLHAKLQLTLEHLPGEGGDFEDRGEAASDSSSSSSSSSRSTEPYPHYNSLKLVGRYIYMSGRDIREALEPHVDNQSIVPIEFDIKALSDDLEELVQAYKGDTSDNN